MSSSAELDGWAALRQLGVLLLAVAAVLHDRARADWAEHEQLGVQARVSMNAAGHMDGTHDSRMLAICVAPRPWEGP